MIHQEDNLWKLKNIEQDRVIFVYDEQLEVIIRKGGSTDIYDTFDSGDAFTILDIQKFASEVKAIRNHYFPQIKVKI